MLSEVCDNAPNSCRLALRHCHEDFRTGESVQFYPGGIRIGQDKWISYSQCQQWHPPDLSITAAQFHRISWHAWSVLIHQEIKNSSSLFYYRGDNIFYRELEKQLNHHRESLLHALRSDLNPQTAISGLLGLGIGLTPTGDDWLTGFFAIWLLPGHPGCKDRQHFISAVAQAKNKTTLLSAVTLGAAIQHRYRESIGQFIKKIANNDSKEITDTLTEIKKIGSSSGCDMLCGMADACALTACFGEHYDHQDSYQKEHLF